MQARTFCTLVSIGMGATTLRHQRTFTITMHSGESEQSSIFCTLIKWPSACEEPVHRYRCLPPTAQHRHGCNHIATPADVCIKRLRTGFDYTHCVELVTSITQTECRNRESQGILSIAQIHIRLARRGFVPEVAFNSAQCPLIHAPHIHTSVSAKLCQYKCAMCKMHRSCLHTDTIQCVGINTKISAYT